MFVNSFLVTINIRMPNISREFVCQTNNNSPENKLYKLLERRRQEKLRHRSVSKQTNYIDFDAYDVPTKATVASVSYVVCL